MDLLKIQRAIADLRNMGIEPESFRCTPETKAAIENLSVTVTIINRAEMEKIHGPIPMTLLGIPLNCRV